MFQPEGLFCPESLYILSFHDSIIPGYSPTFSMLIQVCGAPRLAGSSIRLFQPASPTGACGVRRQAPPIILRESTHDPQSHAISARTYS